MIDFGSWLDLPLIWGLLIATAVFLYVLLDGFDLGCGILFPLAPSDKCRNKIMNSIAPFWDGNETWLVLGGGGLFVAFPVAYGILMSALYMPIILMLIGLIFRGVAFEFRFKSHSAKQQKFWDISFHAGSLLAALMQGIILGNFIQGVEVTGRSFSGSALDWANGFAIFTGIALTFGYALIGACWIIMKTDKETAAWARSVANYSLTIVTISIAIVSISIPLIDERIARLWFSTPNIFFLMPLPILSAFGVLKLYHSINKKQEYAPFLLTIALFLLCYLGFGISLYPWIVPYSFTLWQAAAVSTSQSIVLIGVLIFLPIILCYTAYCYYIFRGKTSSESHY